MLFDQATPAVLPRVWPNPTVCATPDIHDENASGSRRASLNGILTGSHVIPVTWYVGWRWPGPWCVTRRGTVTS